MQQHPKSRGFVEIVVLVLVALVIVFLVGLEPAEVWSEWLKPLIVKVWDVFVLIAKAIATAIKDAV